MTMKMMTMDTLKHGCITFAERIVIMFVIMNVHAIASVLEPEPLVSEYFLQQISNGASYVKGEGSRDGVLTMHDIANRTIVFSDRPNRVIGQMDVVDFVIMFFGSADGEADNGDKTKFFDEPPQGILFCSSTILGIIRAVFQLHTPIFSLDDTELSYNVDVHYASGFSSTFVCDGLTTLVIRSYQDSLSTGYHFRYLNIIFAVLIVLITMTCLSFGVRQLSLQSLKETFRLFQNL